MSTRTARSFCRICAGACGMQITVDDNNAIVDIRGDKQAPLTRGYACFKGLQAEEAHHGAARLLHPLKRNADGSFARIPLEQALDEISAKMRDLIEDGGPEAVSLFCGNGSIFNATAYPMTFSFMRSLGSSQYYSTQTIDQSAKLVTFERLGGWAAGAHSLRRSEVVMLFGTNPLISHCTSGFLIPDPTKRLREEKARGLKLIVIDPRSTETAHHADLVLQPIPGQDAAIAGGLIRLILSEGWEDKDFCAAHVRSDALVALRTAVDSLTPEIRDRCAPRWDRAGTIVCGGRNVCARSQTRGGNHWHRPVYVTAVQSDAASSRMSQYRLWPIS